MIKIKLPIYFTKIKKNLNYSYKHLLFFVNEYQYYLLKNNRSQII